MTRREAIRRTAFAMGGTLSASAVLAVMQGCKPHRDINWEPVFFTEDEAGLVTVVCDIIIPTTDTPGAVEAGVPQFIETMVSEVYTNEGQEHFRTSLKAFDEQVREQKGISFNNLDKESQETWVRERHDAAMKENTNGRGRPFVMTMKELTMLGYFTSEPGATQVLQYDDIPGSYQGCLPLDQVGRTWAT